MANADTEIVDLESKALEINTQAQKIAVKSQSNYDQASSFLRGVKELQDSVKRTFRPIIEAAYKTHRNAVAEEKKHLEPLEKAENLIKGKMLDWMREQERIRRESEAKLQAEADKKRQELLAKAEVARANSKEAKADRYEEKATNIIAPQLAPTIDTCGAGIRKYWSAEVVDLMALVKAISEGKVPLMAVEANMPFLNKQAAALKETLSYPGVRPVSRDGFISARG